MKLEILCYFLIFYKERINKSVTPLCLGFRLWFSGAEKFSLGLLDLLNIVDDLVPYFSVC